MIHNIRTTADTAQTSALAVDGAQPAWMTLNEARERAFTGEIVFEADPEVLAYLDNGIVYYAERASDVSLGRRLLEAGVVDIEQLDRGTVRVGDVEHLGRLFDRDPSVDREAVVVMAETFTEALIAELANRETTTVRVTAYRHHASGIHRWFVAPIDPATVQRPVSALAQLDSTVVDELPGLPFADADELTIEWDVQIEWDDEIEWDDQIVETDQVVTSDGSAEPGLIEETVDADMLAMSLDVAEFTDVEDEVDELVVVEPVDELVIAEPVVVEPVDELVIDDLVVVEPVDELVIDDLVVVEPVDEFRFAIVWPDGAEESAGEATNDVEPPTPSLEEPTADEESAVFEPAFIQPDEGSFEFAMPPLTLSDEPATADAEVPDDVAAAVRRAIAAIESAGADAPAVETVDETAIAAMWDVAPAGRGGFAPPTMATRAEVLYGQMADDGSVLDASAFDGTVEQAVPTLAESSPADGMEPVVVDDPVDEDSSGGERSSALRRLIGSLRRKGH